MGYLVIKTIIKDIYFIDLSRINLISDIFTNIDNDTIKKNLLIYFHGIFYDILIKNYEILYIEELPILEIPIFENHQIITSYPVIADYEIKKIPVETGDPYRGDSHIYESPEINQSKYKYLICIKDKIKYNIDLKEENSYIRRLLDFFVYNKKIQSIVIEINKLIKEISLIKYDFDSFLLEDSKAELIELKYNNCETYEDNLNKFIDYLLLYNSFNDGDNYNKLEFVVNDSYILLTFINQITFFKSNKTPSGRSNYILENDRQKYLQDFILFNKHFWEYKIDGDVNITKDIFFENIFDENTYIFNGSNKFTLTFKKEILKYDKLQRDKIISEKKDEMYFNIILEKLQIQNTNDDNYIEIKKVNISHDFLEITPLNKYCLDNIFYLIITSSNNKYRIQLKHIIKHLNYNIFDFSKLYDLIIRTKFRYLNIKKIIHHRLVIIKYTKDLYTYNTDFKDITPQTGGNKYNKYTLNELKEIAKKNKIKITKMVVISNDELHKKLKDKNIIINKKIKLEDFKRILMENNIKITKRVNLTKQELIKKLISK